MKRSLLFIMLFGIMVSCKDTFEPFGELKEMYALNCIIEDGSIFQIASLTRTYSNENYNPYSNIIDPVVVDAHIRIWSGDSVMALRDSVFSRPSNSQYQTPYHLYYTNKFNRVQTPLEIEAILPDKVILRSKIFTMPDSVKFIYAELEIPPKDKTQLEFVWNPGKPDNAYITQLLIYYYKKDDPGRTVNTAFVPLKYIYQDGHYFPVSPQPTNLNKLIVDMDTFSKTMELISEGDVNKANYVILGPELIISSFDKSLGTYFNSITRTNDAYSVNLNEVDYSNIDNGYGIFGVYTRKYWPIDLSYDYIRSFGYSTPR